MLVLIFPCKVRREMVVNTEEEDGVITSESGHPEEDLMFYLGNCFASSSQCELQFDIAYFFQRRKHQNS